MLSAELEYYRPSTIQEALEQFLSLKRENKLPLYYTGGTEIITLARLNLIQTKAIIDLKDIKECLAYEVWNDSLITGSALPLTFIEDKNLFPLLTQTSTGIADHTARNKITLGGNLCGQIFFREAVLPFLVCESHVIIAGMKGIQSVPMKSIFNQTFQLEEGQFLVQLLTDKKYLNLPFITIKKRQQWETGYPLLTIASIKVDGQLRFGFSGLCPFPFRSESMENELNNPSYSFEERINKSLEHIPGPVLNDMEGSKEYRLFVLKNTLIEILLGMEGK